MLKSYFLLAIRTFARHKASFIINLLGMGIALGCCITAYVNYEYNAEFDKLQQNTEKIYRIGFWQESENKQIPYGLCPMPAASLIGESLSGEDQLVRYISTSAQFRIEDEMFQRQLVYADPNFPNVFTIELISGSLNLENKGHILISDQLAVTYYGRTDVVGQPLTQIISGEPREFEIGGVYKTFPFNSSFRFDLLTSYDNYFIDNAQKSLYESDWSRWVTAFLYVNDNSYLPALSKQLEQYIQPQNEARPDLKVKSYYVESFVGMSRRAINERNQGHWLNGPMPPAAVVAPIVMASMLLLVACFNFMNNTIAVAGNRLKEIGIRKVIGGKRKELVIQFLSETLIFSIFALLLSLVLAEYLTAGWNSLWAGIEINIRYEDNFVFMTAIALLLLITSLLAGGYSAFYISSFRPIQILRGTTRLGGTNWLTKSLLVFQFTISLATVIFALSFYFNSRFQKEFDLGYSYQSVIQVPLDNPQQFDQLKNELLTNPRIKSVGGSQHHIYTTSYKAAARAENQTEKEIDVLNVGNDYFETVNVRVIAGMGFERDSQSDVESAMLVNEQFVRTFNLGDNAIGQRILLNDSLPVFVKGIVKDVYLRALFQPLTPLAFRYVSPDNYRYLVASTDPENLIKLNQEIKTSWQKLFPNILYTGKLMEQDMVMAMEHFDGVVILYTFLGLVAIVMSVSGLYSLVSLSLLKRTKEFGVRKILGATLSHITFQASKVFLVIMLFAFVLGSVAGAVMVNGMMDSVWEYYIAADIRVISLAAVILFMIAVSTIGYKIAKVATHNPVDSLRYE